MVEGFGVLGFPPCPIFGRQFIQSGRGLCSLQRCVKISNCPLDRIDCTAHCDNIKQNGQPQGQYSIDCKNQEMTFYFLQYSAKARNVHKTRESVIAAGGENSCTESDFIFLNFFQFLVIKTETCQYSKPAHSAQLGT